MTTENPSAPVPAARQRERTKPAEDVRLRWSWTEPTVWTNRMLTALEQGVKGGQWHALVDKVYSESNLRASYVQVAANKGAAGVDHVTIEDFGNRLEDELRKLSQTLREGTYQPQSVRRVRIPKPGTHETRPLGIPTVRDRVVQAAVVHAIEPIFEKDFAEQSYGFRPKRGCKDALRRVDVLLKAGYTYVVDVDLKSYFDTIPHDRLMIRLAAKVVDGRLLRLIDSFLKARIMEELTQWTPETGAPQGAVLSPLLSNVYLNPLDQLMADAGIQMVRYADDFVLLCRSAAEAAQALEWVRIWTAENGLTVHPTKTQIIDARTDAFDFLGYRFAGGTRYPRAKSQQKLKDTIRQKTRRSSGESLSLIVAELNRTLRGWFEYFKHSHRTAYPALDSWIRKRLRSILRKRNGLRGPGRGRDHQRWSNAFFAKQGLFSLVEAHALAVQSSLR
jgi:RNA-directed DNA polymerase